MTGDERKLGSAQPITNAAGAVPSMAWTNDPRPQERFPVLDMEHALQYGNALFSANATRAEELTEYQWANLCYRKLARFPAASSSDTPELASLRERANRLLKNPTKDSQTWASIALARNVEPDERLSHEETEQMNLARQMRDPLARRARSRAAAQLAMECTPCGQLQLLQEEESRGMASQGTPIPRQAAGKPLKGAKEICAALGRKHQAWRSLVHLSRATSGPLHRGKRGKQLIVFDGKLLDWFSRAAEKWNQEPISKSPSPSPEFREERPTGSSAKPALDIPDETGRIAYRVKQRRSDRGRQRKPKQT